MQAGERKGKIECDVWRYIYEQLRVDAQGGGAEEVLLALREYIRRLCRQVESHAVAHIGLCLTADGAQAELFTDDFSQERVLQLLQLAQRLPAARQVQFEASATHYEADFDAAQYGRGFWGHFFTQRQNEAVLRSCVQYRCIEASELQPQTDTFLFCSSFCGEVPCTGQWSDVEDIDSWDCSCFCFEAKGGAAAAEIESLVLKRFAEAEKLYWLDVPEGFKNGVLRLQCTAQVKRGQVADFIEWLYGTAALLQDYGFDTCLAADFVPEFLPGNGSAFAVMRLTLEHDTVCVSCCRF